MASDTSLLTFSIGPVHTFIAQARRIADLWAGSALLSTLIGKAIEVIHSECECEMIFPAVRPGDIPKGLPNRFVCRVPSGKEGSIAESMSNAVFEEWNECVRKALTILEEHAIIPDESIWTESGSNRQTDKVFDISWSWVPEKGNYAEASSIGASRFRSSRVFRPFSQVAEEGEKCAICGERTALPNGKRADIRSAWKSAEEKRSENKIFFRGDQSRLCLVCATKRLFPLRSGETAYFSAFDTFQPAPDKPYFAVVAMDGDNMGKILGWKEGSIKNGDVLSFHQEVSKILTEFAENLHLRGTSRLNFANFMATGWKPLGKQPELIYAGGEDVLFTCDPRDALPLARGICYKYRNMFEKAKPMLEHADDYKRFTISAGILYCHTKHPAGLIFRDLQNLLVNKAKAETGRDAIALKLDKRGGAPVSVAFKWDALHADRNILQLLNEVIERISDDSISSSQIYNITRETRTLAAVLESEDDWIAWLKEKLSRGNGSSATAEELARSLAPFFMEKKTDALRIARFLAKEVV